MQRWSGLARWRERRLRSAHRRRRRRDAVWPMLRCRVSPPTSPGACPPPRTRSRAPSPRTVADRPSGTRSPTPPAPPRGHTGDVACDHYHRWEADLDLIAGLGAGAYRFSVAWSRVQPTGDGRPPTRPASTSTSGSSTASSPAATTRCHAVPLGPAAGAAGPGRLANRDTAMRFGEYAELAERLGDRVKLWITLNEPYIHSPRSCARCVRPRPGRWKPTSCRWYTICSWPMAWPSRRCAAPRTPRSRWPTTIRRCGPGTSDADQTAAAIYDLVQNHLFTDPILLGGTRPATSS